MSNNTKIIKTRIKSIGNTKKITKSMQMISAVKMQKSVKQVSKSKMYSNLVTELLQKLQNVPNEIKNTHPMLAPRSIKNELLVVLSSNRGLCGSFNTTVLNEAKKYYLTEKKRVEEEGVEHNFSVLAIGRKSAHFAKKYELPLIGLFEKITDNPRLEVVIPIYKQIIKDYLDNKYDKVTVIHTEFITSLSQNAKVTQLLPIIDLEDPISDSQNESGKLDKEELESEAVAKEISPEVIVDYLYEPNEQELFAYIIPKLIQVQLYQIVLESSASEHSSRMISMKNSTDNASELMDLLTLEFNKGRQRQVTQEIAEIVSGMEVVM